MKYHEIPYVFGGRDEKGVDCWGLVCLFYRVELGLDIPLFENHFRAHAEIGTYLADSAALQSVFHPVSDAPRRGDIILIANHSSVVNHCGVMTDDRRFLHALSSAGVALSLYPRWSDRVRGVYRHACTA